MNQSLPFLPGYSFRDTLKSRYVFPSTLVYSKGVPLSKSILSSSSQNAVALLDAENKILDRETITRLTYGPKRALTTETKLPRYLALDKKVLRFNGYIREETDDWASEKYRIRPVNVLYYLQNDTMEVIEPKTANSGLVQGTLLKRHAFPHPHGKGRRYLWKDLNIGMDLRVYGMCIRLANCDEYTKEYLTDAGLELNDPEAIPPDPHEEYKLSMQDRREVSYKHFEDEKLFKFLTNDRKVLRFYGIWQDVLNDPPDIRRVILQYYLVDDTMELLEEHVPNSGRLPMRVVVKKQKIPININELPENFPSSYLEIKDEDLTFYKPKDLRTGKDVMIFGKKIFLYDCDDFTRHFYRTHYGIEDMESIKVAEKPKAITHRIFPPHVGIGGWDDSLQNCISLVPKAPKKDFNKQLYFEGITLRYKAELVTTAKEEQCRQFVLTFYPVDDTIAINEEAVPNSGFPPGAFWKRNKLLKPESQIATQPIYYKANDLYIGAEIKAAGKLFKLVDADKFVHKFMKQHPELYTDEHLELHEKAFNHPERDIQVMDMKKCLLKRIREKVIEKYGVSPYPLPHCLKPPLALQQRDILDEELFCAELPIERTMLAEVLKLCSDSQNRIDMNEVREILLPALGHDTSS